jgi:hypothetical protein
MHMRLSHFHLRQSFTYLLFALTCISLIALTVSHLLLLDCYISFTPSSNQQHTLLSLAISLRSGILLASQPSFAALGSFCYSYLLLHICYFLVPLISISLPSNPFPCTILHLCAHPSLNEIFYHCVLSCIFIASPSPLALPLASLLAVGWVTCLIALRALHCPFPCSIGPSSHHYLHASRQSNVHCY